MKRRNMTGVLAALPLMAMLAFAANENGNQAKDQVLKTGTYSAEVKALVCSACGPLVEKTVKKVKGIESATVDSESSTLRFTVEKGKKIKTSVIQKALDQAAADMGMGADFTLSDLKPAKKGDAKKASSSDTAMGMMECCAGMSKK